MAGTAKQPRLAAPGRMVWVSKSSESLGGYLSFRAIHPRSLISGARASCVFALACNPYPLADQILPTRRQTESHHLRRPHWEALPAFGVACYRELNHEVLQRREGTAETNDYLRSGGFPPRVDCGVNSNSRAAEQPTVISLSVVHLSAPVAWAAPQK